MTLCEVIRSKGVSLKPCPFCGCDVDDFPLVMVLKESHSDEYLLEKLKKGHIISSDNGYEIVCPSCGAKSPHDRNPIFVINWWNTRRKKQKKDCYGFNEFPQGYCIQLSLSDENKVEKCCGKCWVKRKDGE